MRAGVPQLAIGRDDVHCYQVVYGEPEPSPQPSEAAPQRKAADARVRHGAGRGYQAVRHRLMIEIAQEAAAQNVGPARDRIDAHAPHARQVELHAAVTG